MHKLKKKTKFSTLATANVEATLYLHFERIANNLARKLLQKYCIVKQLSNSFHYLFHSAEFIKSIFFYNIHNYTFFESSKKSYQNAIPSIHGACQT